MKTYRALQRGFVDGAVIEAGQLFTTAAPAGKWMEEVDSTPTDEASQEAEPAGEDEKPAKRGAK